MNRVVDLTMTVRDGMRGVSMETATTVEREGWNARHLHLYSHAGTHMDSPYHFAAGDQTIDEIPPDRLMGRAWVFDVRGVPPRQPMTVSDLGDGASRVQPGDGVLLWSDWSRHVDDADYYRDHFPPIGLELAKWFVDRGVRMLGVEPPSVGDVNDLPAVTAVHQVLLGGDVIIVEGLTNLGSINAGSCDWWALPLKIDRGDGAPCRSLAIVAP